MRFEGRQVAVTGGTGYIGGAVVRALVEAGAQVTVLARRPERARALQGRDRVRLCKADVADAATLDLAGHDVVVHAAAWVAFGIPPSKRDRFWATNVDGTRNVVEAARRAGVAKLVHVSSVAALGATDGAVADETWTPRAEHRSYYETTKRAAHEVALGASDLDVAVVMPGVVVGIPRPWPDGAPASPQGPFDGILARFAEGRLPFGVRGDGRTPYVHVEDVAEGILLAALHGRGPYLLTDGDLTFDELLGALGARLGRRPPRARLPVPAIRLALGAVERWYHAQGKVPPGSTELATSLEADMRFDSTRARKELGWAPDLLRRLAADYSGRRA